MGEISLQIFQFSFTLFFFTAVSSRMIDRLFSGCVTREQSLKDGKMLYVDFIWFILSEVDKATPTRYLFVCLQNQQVSMVLHST